MASDFTLSYEAELEMQKWPLSSQGAWSQGYSFGRDAGASAKEAELRKPSPCGKEGHLRIDWVDADEICESCGDGKSAHSYATTGKAAQGECNNFVWRNGKVTPSHCRACLREDKLVRDLSDALNWALENAHDIYYWAEVAGRDVKDCITRGCCRFCKASAPWNPTNRLFVEHEADCPLQKVRAAAERDGK